MARHVAPSAEVHPAAEVCDDVYVGPHCVVGPECVIGRGTRLENHVTLMGRVTMGEFNHVYPHAVVGGEPQDLTYQGTPTEVHIGSHNKIRESVTINRGSEKEDGVTRVGSHCYLMAGCHVAHDCRLGDRVVMANNVLLGGHVHIDSDATMSGGIGVHHFTSIGSYSFISGLSRVLHDVPPYMLVEGSPARPRCINIVALKRHHFSAEAIKALSEAHRLIYRSRVGLDHARELLRNKGLMLPTVNHLLGFVQCQQEGRHGRSRERRRAA